MALTVAEIGRIAGCSNATVSRALNNSGSVSAKTREAVLKAVRDGQAAGVAEGRSVKKAAGGTGFVEIVYHRHSPFERIDVDHGQMSVGPLREYATEKQLHQGNFQLSHSFYRRIVDAAVTEMNRWGRRAVLQFGAELSDEKFLGELGKTDCSGVLLVGEPCADLETFISRCPHPLVLVDIAFDGWPDVVTTDNTPGIAQAFSHLYDLGHRRIGFGGKMDDNFAHHERFLAFKLKMVEAGLPIRDDWIYEGYSHIEPAVAGMRQILSKADRPTAMLCANDWVALAAIRAASELGIRVPTELSIVGFDDTEASALVAPPLTTVRVPVDDIGRQAVRQLMIQIQAGVSVDRKGTRVRLSPELVVRGSTAKPASASA